MKNQQLLSEEELDEIKEIRELLNESSLVIRTNGAIFNGKEIVIETMSSRGGGYEPIIIIDKKDFEQYNTLMIPRGYIFKTLVDRNYLQSYIYHVGKFTIQKEKGLLDNVVQGFKDIFKFGV